MGAGENLDDLQAIEVREHQVDENQIDGRSAAGDYLNATNTVPGLNQVADLGLECPAYGSPDGAFRRRLPARWAGETCLG
jgi:hypothetical protein